MLESIFGKELSNLHQCDSLESGQKYIASNAIDILFLDLNLNGKDGFEVLEEVVAAPFHTITISAYKEKAIKAFEYGVLDFVPKPFDMERLAKACQRISSSGKTEERIKFLAIKKKGKRYLVNIENIKYIKGAGIYTELFLQDGSKEVHNKSLENLGTLLPDSFERIHKSYLAEMNQAKQIIVESGSKYTLELNSGEQLPIGRTRYKELQSKWFC